MTFQSSWKYAPMYQRWSSVAAIFEPPKLLRPPTLLTPPLLTPTVEAVGTRSRSAIPFRLLFCLGYRNTAIEGVISSSLRRLRDVRHQIVDLNASLEGVAAKNLGHTVRPFDAVDSLNRRGEIAYANMGQTTDCDGGDTAVVGNLGTPPIPYWAGMPKVFP